jgi:hypothetical protein
MPTSLNHQPEVHHPKSPAIHKLAGRLPHLFPESDRRPFRGGMSRRAGRRHQRGGTVFLAVAFARLPRGDCRRMRSHFDRLQKKSCAYVIFS